MFKKIEELKKKFQKNLSEFSENLEDLQQELGSLRFEMGFDANIAVSEKHIITVTNSDITVYDVKKMKTADGQEYEDIVFSWRTVLARFFNVNITSTSRECLIRPKIIYDRISKAFYLCCLYYDRDNKTSTWTYFAGIREENVNTNKNWNKFKWDNSKGYGCYSIQINIVDDEIFLLYDCYGAKSQYIGHRLENFKKSALNLNLILPDQVKKFSAFTYATWILDKKLKVPNIGLLGVLDREITSLTMVKNSSYFLGFTKNKSNIHVFYFYNQRLIWKQYSFFGHKINQADQISQLNGPKLDISYDINSENGRMKINDAIFDNDDSICFVFHYKNPNKSYESIIKLGIIDIYESASKQKPLKKNIDIVPDSYWNSKSSYFLPSIELDDKNHLIVIYNACSPDQHIQTRVSTLSLKNYQLQKSLPIYISNIEFKDVDEYEHWGTYNGIQWDAFTKKIHVISAGTNYDPDGNYEVNGVYRRNPNYKYFWRTIINRFIIE